MSDLITDEVFTDGQTNIAASNMNGIIGLARAQPDLIANKVASSTMNVADQFLVLKTDNTLARAQFQTIVNSVASALPLADSTKNGTLRQLSGNATDFVDGTNNCQPVSNILPAGMVCDYAGPNVPAGWLSCQGTSLLRTAYPALYAAIGTTYGAVDGTHFTLPNFVGRIPFWTGALGSLGGATTMTLAVGHLPSHSHSITDKTHTHTATSTDSGHVHTYVWPSVGGNQWGVGSPAWGQGTSNTGSGNAVITTNIGASATGITTTNAAGSGAPFSIMPPYVCVIKIIKT